MRSLSAFSRRAFVGSAGAVGGVATLTRALPAAAQATPAASPVASPVPATAAMSIPAEIMAIMNGPRYHVAKWGLYVADRESGETVYALNADDWFLAASTTKLWSTAAALDAYGADYRFETPIYREGDVGADGSLSRNLVLVASGDLTMGGRTRPDGTIDYTAIDHINAEALPIATLTPENPVAGLNDLAQQVVKSGIKHVAGDVIIDDRLFPPIHKDSYILTPIWINDNLLDFTVTPGKVGEAASFVWRPETAAYEVQNEVQTVAADQPLTVTVTSPAPGKLLLSGNIPVSQKQLVKTWQVEDPSAFARTLLIEALGRQGVDGRRHADRAEPGGQAASEGLLPAGGPRRALHLAALCPEHQAHPEGEHEPGRRHDDLHAGAETRRNDLRRRHGPNPPVPDEDRARSHDPLAERWARQRVHGPLQSAYRRASAPHHDEATRL